jgi:two-component system sensor histidine kinase TctE
VPIGGRVKVESRTVRDHAVVEISFDARRDPGALLEQLFVPFAPGAVSAHAGLGLAVADQIVREHGGEIRVRSDADWGASVMLTLPIRSNGDRRSAGPDRRQNRHDRRQRAAET